MNWQRVWILVCVMGVLLSGCGGGSGTTTGRVSVSLRVNQSPTRAVSDIKSIKVVISGPYMTEMADTFAFDVQHPEVSRTYQVPIGIDRKFHMDALDASDNVLYTGETVKEIAVGDNSISIDLFPNAAFGQANLQLGIPNVPASLKGYLPGLAFSPYMDGQDPNRQSQISEQQIRDRLAIIAPWCNSIRYFGSTDGLERIGPIAKSEFGMKVMAGVWLGRDQTANARQVTNAIATARSGGCDSICVGSEVLLRGDLAEGSASSQPGDGTLIGYIKQVKEAVDVPVTYSDTHNTILAHPAVVAECEGSVMVNIYAYWEQVDARDALNHLKTNYQRVVTAYPGKQIVIGEVGWPTAGNAQGAAVPNPGNARRFFKDVLIWMHTNSINGYWFSSHDEQWKTASEGGLQGASWGIWQSNGVMKPEYHEVLF